MLVDPHGNLVTSRKREVRINHRKVAQFVAYADDVFKQTLLTVVCPTCGQTPVCNNAPTDAFWKMECSCTVRMLKNPEVH